MNDTYQTALKTQKRSYALNKAQAKFRQEEWQLTYTDYCMLWKDHLNDRGRDGEHYQITRRDRSKPWTMDNAIVITRTEINGILHKRK